MKKRTVKTEKVKIEPIRRMQILFNQRIHHFEKDKLIDSQFISDLFDQKKELDKRIKASIRTACVYMVIIYLTAMGVKFKFSLLGLELDQIPYILEISTLLFSFSLIFIGMQFLDDQVHRRIIDSVIAIHHNEDGLIKQLVRSRYYADTYFYHLFTDRSGPNSESIEPRLAAKLLNSIMKFTGILSIGVLAFSPITLLCLVAFPVLWFSISGKVIMVISSITMIFFTSCILSCWVKLPYNEHTAE